MKHRAQKYLDRIDKKLQSDHWSGYAQTGCRNQTNASFGPSQQSLFGATRPINSQFVLQPDWSWFGAFGLNYVHDFGNRGDGFEANVLGCDAQQFKVTSVDTEFLDIHVGPRFDIFQDSLSGASIKPYVVATGATLADAPYLGSFGDGVTMHFNWANVASDPYVEFRRLDYHKSGLYPLASGLDVTLATFALQATGQIIEGVRWQARFAFNHSDDAFPWDSYDRYADELWFRCTVPSPWGGRSWAVTPSFGVSTNIPIRDKSGFGVQLEYRAINSNIPGNTVKDLAVTMSQTASF